MQIAMLGTGAVGQTLSTKLVDIGHDVMMGSRSAGNIKGKTVLDVFNALDFSRGFSPRLGWRTVTVSPGRCEGDATVQHQGREWVCLTSLVQ